MMPLVSNKAATGFAEEVASKLTHTVQQRSRDSIERISRSNEEHFAKVQRDIDVVIHKCVVL